MADDRQLPRSSWTPIVLRVIVALIVATPFVAIILQAIGKLRAAP